ncbi:Ibr domain protein (macronuclear) [Tetrahymena thermophila SB210]|uniref:RBR-type E3 ubiquitin transferase n=1 Tax=Tetrahymena thermophila (strain SB210) TaxID=312017 RepID=I7MCI1_TETTS|nr:Ibr domain protein [Tetrahymena thermophila SB210]EAR83989.2 Ibr domain protein [Tetrahymena thermophila SB210]|eukprot:XP_001031652.2 Ibr domain protein [Tetrahymena thermophila SB210]
MSISDISRSSNNEILNQFKKSRISDSYFVQKQNSQEQDSIYCAVHMENVPLDQTLKLPCQHIFCKECLIAQYENCIKEGQISQQHLKCPQEDCNTPIPYFMIKNLLSPQVFEMYERLSFASYETSITSNEIGITCPQKDCNARFSIWKGAFYTKCPLCNYEFCTECKYAKHSGISCEQYKEQNIQSKEDLAFFQMMKINKWKQCPVCKSVVVKEKWCNFLRCSSSICQKKTCFCYLCCDVLNEEDHYIHYIDKNPYKDNCVTMQLKKEIENIPDTNPKEELVKNIECPGCQTKDRSLCEVISNFNYQICYCQSYKCKQFFCLNCNKKFKDGDRAADHFLKNSCKKSGFQNNCQIF